MLDPQPTEDHIEEIREIVDLPTSKLSEITARVNLLTQAAWTKTIKDIEKWEPIRDKHNVISGKGITIDKAKNRLDIRNRVRRRLDYPEVDENGQLVGSVADCYPFGTISVNRYPGW